ncbi:hypothetical protein M9Y10_027865 [Tritrichomonas musculus]|uniref:Uncharacterized protein n=1 Tax=Tritrichomonas musculus TaxID=1915356 RepID=A0ABR2H496_9EUKA
MIAFLFGLIASKVSLGINEERQFLQWMRENNRFYTGDEYHLRLGIFISNARYCQEFNRRKGLTFHVGLNQFSCHTPAEYKAILGVRGNKAKYFGNKSKEEKQKFVVPDSCDWRDKGVVNPIKDQGSCGSCWAFSTIASSESAYAITSGKLLRFSEQNLVDCAPCLGCNGGWPNVACFYIINYQKGQFNTESDYPYTAAQGSCLFDSTKSVGKITEYISVEEDSEDDLKEKIAQYGIASVTISANNAPFMSYTGGILDNDQCSIFTDHAVAAVGYGSENGSDYWIVRNSWGISWGEEGYVRMIRNKDNQCQIASQAFVVIDSE